MPLVLAYAKVDDDELREHCLQACKFELGNTECFMYLSRYINSYSIR